MRLRPRCAPLLSTLRSLTGTRWFTFIFYFVVGWCTYACHDARAQNRLPSCSSFGAQASFTRHDLGPQWPLPQVHGAATLRPLTLLSCGGCHARSRSSVTLWRGAMCVLVLNLCYNLCVHCPLPLLLVAPSTLLIAHRAAQLPLGPPRHQHVCVRRAQRVARSNALCAAAPSRRLVERAGSPWCAPRLEECAT